MPRGHLNHSPSIRIILSDVESSRGSFIGSSIVVLVDQHQLSYQPSPSVNTIQPSPVQTPIISHFSSPPPTPFDCRIFETIFYRLCGHGRVRLLWEGLGPAHAMAASPHFLQLDLDCRAPGGRRGVDDDPPPHSGGLSTRPMRRNVGSAPAMRPCGQEKAETGSMMERFQAR